MFNSAVSMRELELEAVQLLPRRETLCVMRLHAAHGDGYGDGNGCDNGYGDGNGCDNGYGDNYGYDNGCGDNYGYDNGYGDSYGYDDGCNL